MPQTAVSRWTKSESYHSSWGDRSKALLDLHSNAAPHSIETSFTEYGCGPDHPFARTLGPDKRCLRYDIKAWDEGCRVVDLNNPSFEVESTDVAVMSGVLEYMNKPSKTLERLSNFHKFLLVSYYPVADRHLFYSGQAAEVKKRAEVNGWRNHLRFQEVLAVTSEHWFVVSLSEYKRQILMLLEAHN